MGFYLLRRRTKVLRAGEETSKKAKGNLKIKTGIFVVFFLETIMENIEAYDGTSAGQKDVN